MEAVVNSLLITCFWNLNLSIPIFWIWKLLIPNEHLVLKPQSFLASIGKLHGSWFTPLLHNHLQSRQTGVFGSRFLLSVAIENLIFTDFGCSCFVLDFGWWLTDVVYVMEKLCHNDLPLVANKLRREVIWWRFVSRLLLEWPRSNIETFPAEISFDTILDLVFFTNVDSFWYPYQLDW